MPVEAPAPRSGPGLVEALNMLPSLLPAPLRENNCPQCRIKFSSKRDCKPVGAGRHAGTAWRTVASKWQGSPTWA